MKFFILDQGSVAKLNAFEILHQVAHYVSSAHKKASDPINQP